LKIIGNCILPVYGIALNVCSPIRRKNWIIGYCNSREKWWGEGRGCNQNPSNTYLVTKANEYNRGELTLHPEQENPGTGMAS